MKMKTLGMGAIVALFVLCFGLPASAQVAVSVQSTGGDTATWGAFGIDYDAGIFGATIYGINGTTSRGIVSDDFNVQSNSGQTWNANAFQASSLTSANIGSTQFGATIGLTGYAEVATLVSMMFNNRTTYDGLKGITQADLSAAIWDITTPGGIKGLNAKTKALVAEVEIAYIGNVTKAEAYLATKTNLWILDPTSAGSGEAEEMWTKGLKVPEGGTALMYLLLAGFSCFFATLFNSKKRIGRSVTA